MAWLEPGAGSALALLGPGTGVQTLAEVCDCSTLPCLTILNGLLSHSTAACPNLVLPKHLQLTSWCWASVSHHIIH